MSKVNKLEPSLSCDKNEPRFMNVKQVADYLQLNEKKVYALVSEGKIPGTKITGKWMFPRTLIDNWIIESSHGGLLTDRLIIVGSDDPLLQRVIMNIANNIQSNGLVSYTCTGTRLGLSLLAHHKADICTMHWGPYEESYLRHPALLNQYPQHRNWVLVRLFKREQGLLINKICLMIKLAKVYSPPLKKISGGALARMAQDHSVFSLKHYNVITSWKIR